MLKDIFNMGWIYRNKTFRNPVVHDKSNFLRGAIIQGCGNLSWNKWGY